MNQKITVLHARVSSYKQSVRGHSLEEQLRELRAFAKKQEYTKVLEFVENGVSAKSLIARKDFIEIIQLIKSGKVENYVTTYIDRMNRNTEDFLFLQKLIQEYGVTLIGLYFDGDMSSASKRHAQRREALEAEYYIERLSENVHRGLTGGLAKGLYIKPRPPYGYSLENHRLYPIPSEIENVKYIFKLYLEGNLATNSIALVTKSFDSRLRFPKAISRILGNSIYIDVVVKDGKEYSGFVEPIIDKYDSNMVQNRLKQGRKAKKYKYYFEDVVHCVHCLHPLSVTCAHGRDKEYLYYECTNRYCDCYNKRINQGIILDHVVTAVFDNYHKTIKSQFRFIDSQITQKFISISQRLYSLSKNCTEEDDLIIKLENERLDLIEKYPKLREVKVFDMQLGIEAILTTEELLAPYKQLYPKIMINLSARKVV